MNDSDLLGEDLTEAAANATETSSAMDAFHEFAHYFQVSRLASKKVLNFDHKL
jgi:hypothetical protein